MTPRNDDPTLSNLIGEIYEACLEPERWCTVAAEVAKLVDGTGAGLGMQDNASRSLRHISSRIDPEAMRQHDEYYCWVNPLMPAILRSPPGKILPNKECMPGDELEKTEYYHGFLKPNGICDGLGAILLRDPDWLVFFASVRFRPAGEFERKHIRLYEILVPHFLRAMQIQLRLERLGIEHHGLMRVLDLTPHGILIVDKAARVLFANRTAESLLARADGLRLSAGALAGGRPTDTKTLRALITSAAGPLEVMQRLGGALSLARQPPLRPLAAIVAPFQLEASWLLRQRAAALVVVSDPEHKPAVPAERLRQLFGLSRQEAAVVLRLLAGDDIKALADALNITMATARTHIQHVFDKTEVRRQTELVRLLSACLGPIDACDPDPVPMAAKSLQ